MSKSTIIEIGKKKFNLVRKGRKQAGLVISLTSWISKYALPLFEKFATPEGTANISYTDLFGTILEGLSEDALVELYSVLIGTSSEFADEHFDINDLVTAATTVWETQPGIQELVSRFFSTQD